MKRTVLVVALLVLWLAPGVEGSEADAILGPWLTAVTEEGRARVEIVKEDDRYSGTIVWLAIPVYPEDDEQGMGGKPKVDRENPDEALRGRPVIGIEIVAGFK